MRNMTTICAITAAAVLLSGCSTRPRNFSASLSAPVEDRAAFESDYRTCSNLVRSGHTANFKSTAATGLAAGVGAAGAGAAMASTGMVGAYMSGGAAFAAAAAMPVVGILAGFGVSRAIRGGKERKMKRSMTACLAEYGYGVESWDKLHKRDDAARISAESADVASETISTAAVTTVASNALVDNEDTAP